MIKRYLTPSFFIGCAAVAIIAAAQALSVYNGDFETVTLSAVAVVVATAIVRAVGIYVAGKIE